MSALLDAVRQKYPQYADKSDDELALAIGSKYPTYLDRDADFKKEFTASRIQAEMALKPSPKPDLGQPFAEVQPGGRVIQRMPGNDPERNREELAKAFQPLLPQTSDEDRMRANLRQMSLAEDVSPTPKAEIAETLSKPYQPPNKTLAGVVKGVEGLAEGFTSPVGIATLGMGALPRAAQKVVSLAFAAQMVKQVPELAAQLGTEFGKPPEQRDQQKIAQLITEGAGTVGFTTLAAKHGLAPEPAPKPMQGPLATGAVLQMPKGANPLATIGDHLEAKGITLPSGKPVASPEAPKPPQTPPAPEKQPISQPSTVTEALRKSGYDVKAWDMPGMGKQLQVTSPEAGAAKGMTVYVPENATLEEVTQRLEQKRKEFEDKSILGKAEPEKVTNKGAATLAKPANFNLPAIAQAAISTAKTPREIESAINKHETDIAKKAGNPEGYLSCDAATEIMAAYLREKDIPHEVMYGKLTSGPAKGESHSYIKIGNERFDATHQGFALPRNERVQSVFEGNKAAQPKEKIVAAALRGVNGEVRTGPTHGMVDRDGLDFGDTDENIGFVTDKGRYITQSEAEQLTQGASASEQMASTYKDPEMFQELTERVGKQRAKQIVQELEQREVDAANGKTAKPIPAELDPNAMFEEGNKEPQATPVTPPKSPLAPNLVSSKAEPTVTSKPAKAETAPKEPETQVGLGPSMGAMTPSDPLEPAAGEAGDPDIYGVAERVRSKRAKSGQVEAVPPGQGTTAPDSVEHGRELLGSGADAEASMTEFERTKKMSSNDMALARAKGEELAQSARKIEEQSGTDSPEYKAAKKALSDWDKRSKAMQTEWHKTGMAQQGETDLDTGSFTGLVREFESQTGKEITPKQAQEAKEAAGRVRKAQTELDESNANLQEHLAEQSGTGAEKRALRAANKVVREAAVRLAKAEGKTRVAKTVNERATAKVQEDAERKALQAAQEVARNAAIKMAKADTQARVAETQDTSYIQDKQAQKALQAANEVARKAAVDVAEAENKARTEKAVTQRKQSQVQLKAAKAALDAANKAVRMAAIKAAKAEAENRAHPERRVWERVSDYLNQGGKSFDEIRNRVAADLGLRVKQVTDIITRSPRAKYLADDVWRKQQQLRRFQQGARLWLKQAQTPGYLRAISRVPRGLFNLKVGLHGTVALGTHAPMVAFQPAFWKVYVENFGKMYRMVGSPGYYEMQVQDLLRRKNYITAKRAGLQNDPYQYEDFTSPAVSQYFGRITGMGNRGYSVLRMLRQDLFDQQWESLPKTAQIPEVAKAIADGLNHATGVTKASAPGGASVALFAPRLEASRVAWLAVDPVLAGKTFANWKNATAGEKRFAINQVKEKAWVVGTMMSLLAINQSILSVTDSKQKVNFTDPTKSDFLKFKVAGMNVSYGNAMVTMARLPPRLYEIHAGSGGKLKNLIHPDQSTYDLIGEYFRSQESPATSLGTTLWFKADFENRPLPNSDRAVPKWLRAQGIGPYTWPEFWSEQMLPIPAEDFAREVWKNGLGMSDEQVKSTAKALAVISIMAGTGGRISDDYNLKK